MLYGLAALGRDRRTSRQLLLALYTLLILPCIAVQAQARPVLVELFTSQGCSSCPPADAVLGKLSEDPKFIALTLSVDYWDYLGWHDRFAKAAHTARQRAYQKKWMARSIYTPQIVVDGRRGVVGSDERAVRSAADASPVEIARITLNREGGALQIEIQNAGAAEAEPCSVVLFQYDGPHEVAIGRGENSGETVTYHNVVREVRVLGTWRGEPSRQLSASIDPAMKGYVVALQRGDVGPVVALSRLEN
ncbi:MAG: DUF1223 domain-containing protein [Neomegalonema sp.]|nr:DUF1223 domain-containing protein [Neomegalonema sp.]